MRPSVSYEGHGSSLHLSPVLYGSWHPALACASCEPTPMNSMLQAVLLQRPKSEEATTPSTATTTSWVLTVRGQRRLSLKHFCSACASHSLLTHRWSSLHAAGWPVNIHQMPEIPTLACQGTLLWMEARAPEVPLVQGTGNRGARVLVVFLPVLEESTLGQRRGCLREGSG